MREWHVTAVLQPYCLACTQPCEGGFGCWWRHRTGRAWLRACSWHHVPPCRVPWEVVCLCSADADPADPARAPSIILGAPHSPCCQSWPGPQASPTCSCRAELESPPLAGASLPSLLRSSRRSCPAGLQLAPKCSDLRPSSVPSRAASCSSKLGVSLQAPASGLL